MSGNYTNVKVNISKGQKQKLQNVLQTGGPVSIRLSVYKKYILYSKKHACSQIWKETGKNIITPATTNSLLDAQNER